MTIVHTYSYEISIVQYIMVRESYPLGITCSTRSVLDIDRIVELNLFLTLAQGLIGDAFPFLEKMIPAFIPKNSLSDRIGELTCIFHHLLVVATLELKCGEHDR